MYIEIKKDYLINSEYIEIFTFVKIPLYDNSGKLKQEAEYKIAFKLLNNNDFLYKEYKEDEEKAKHDFERLKELFFYF